MTDGVFRYFSPPLPARPRTRPRRTRNQPKPLIDLADDAEWLQANPHRLGRAHVHNFDLGPNLPPLPVITLCVRLHDVTSPDGWTAAWLEIMPEPDLYGADDDEPSFAPAEWAEVACNPVKEAGWILDAIAYAARTSAPAATVRNLLVAVRSAELGSAAQHFHFIEND